MKKRAEGIKISGIVYNAIIVASAVAALSAVWKIGW